tara:strand:- start:65 stop:1222 length:1158 start_codon:yes stop_codon:yes gene_type:complete
MAITDKTTGIWGLDQAYNKINQGSIWEYSSSVNSFFIWGRNQFGELGQNSPANSNLSSPTQIPGSWSEITSFSGSYSIGGIKTDRTWWAWGKNQYGQLGQNQKDVHYSSPVQIPGTWSEAEIGATNSYGINTSGELFVMGFDNDGAMGVNTKSVSYSSPTQIPGSTWKQVGLNYYGMAATKTDGALWAWGAAGDGQLGQNSRTYYSSPVQIPGTTWSIVKGTGSSNFLAIKTDGTLWAWGANGNGALGLNQATGFKASSPTQVGSDSDWSDISAGGCVGAIKTDGTLWMWGSGGSGRLGQNATQSKSSPVQVPGTTWAQVKCDSDRTYARKTDGSIWAMGANEYGTLGQNSPGPSGVSSPIQIGSDTDWSSVGATQMMGVALKKL